MADDKPTGEEVVKDPAPAADPTPSADPAIAKGDWSPEEKGSVPYERMVALNERMKIAEASLKKNQDDQEAVRVATLEEKGEHKKLADERGRDLAIAQEENKEFRAERDKEHAAILAELPDANREFAVKHELNLNTLRDYRKQVSPNGGVVDIKDPNPDSPGGKYVKPDKPVHEMTRAEQLEWSKHMDEQYAPK